MCAAESSFTERSPKRQKNVSGWSSRTSRVSIAATNYGTQDEGSPRLPNSYFFQCGNVQPQSSSRCAGRLAQLSAQNLLRLEHSVRQASVSSCGASSEVYTEQTHHTLRENDSSSSSSISSDASSIDYQDDFFGCWQATRKLCSGNNGQVYLGRLANELVDAQVALKVEKRSLRRSHLKNEVCRYFGVPCI